MRDRDHRDAAEFFERKAIADRAAAPASERPLPPLPAEEYRKTVQDAIDALMACDRDGDYPLIERLEFLLAASAPQAVRMPLTKEQIRTMRAEAKADPRCAEEHWFVLLVRAVEKYHGIVPLAPQDTGGK